MMFYVHFIRCVLVAVMIATTPYRYGAISKSADAGLLWLWCTLLCFYAVQWGQFLATEKKAKS